MLRVSASLGSRASSEQAVRFTANSRYHAGLVVEVARNPLTAVEREVGVDLGLHVLALSDGTTVLNPRWLRQAEQRLRRAQRTSAVDGRDRPTAQCQAQGRPPPRPRRGRAGTSTTGSPPG